MNPKNFVKSALRATGFDLARLSSLSANRNQPADDPFIHQKRLSSLQNVTTIFDVGANRGQTTAQYRRLFPTAVVYSFEPFDATFRTLAEIFAGSELVKPFRLALTDVAGVRPFYCSSDSVMNSLLPLSQQADLLTTSVASGVVEVQTSTLDVFCREHGIDRIDILKLDVQGAELQALQGGARLLEGQRVGMVYTEVNFNSLYVGQTYFHDVSSFLHGYGYSLYGLYQVAYSPLGPIGWADALFVSGTMLEQIRGGTTKPMDGPAPSSHGARTDTT